METQRSRRTGFTLVELLVVISIITVLAALLVPAVYFAIQKAKEGRIALELANIEKALEGYKLQYGEYPPDFAELGNNGLYPTPTAKAMAAQAIIDGHLSRIFRQRISDGSNANADFPRDSTGTNRLMPNDLLALYSKLGPHNALQFWLRGFSPDPAHPLFGGGERQPLFEFDKSRFFLDSTAPKAFNFDGGESLFLAQYFPQGSLDPSPYLYYRANPTSTFANQARSYMATTYSLPPARSEAHAAYVDAAVWANANNTTRPYFSYTPGAPNTVLDNNMPGGSAVQYPPTFRPYAEPKKFQLITAGLDSLYGVGGNPAKQNPIQHIGNVAINKYDPADKKNMTNFSAGKALEDLQAD